MIDNKTSRPKPPAENLKRVGSQPFDTHVKRGYAILSILVDKASTHGKEIAPDTNIYDFGCGVGRVTIPLAEKYQANIFGSDVDHTAIEFLNKNFSSQLKAVTTKYKPPLPFDDNYFDIIYSISVWSHFPDDLQYSWLEEMQRIMKQDALLLISTAGISHLENWHKKGKRTEISADMLREKGSLFIKNTRLDDNPEMFPGVTDDWGVFYQTPDHIRAAWSDLFEIEEIDEACIGKQDLIILRKK